ncbi:MAG: hypothetical protein GX279_10505 [Clostridiaceae bacterium]|nr:hypothetical protein [Clostridiaceae bacterium]
MGEYQKLIEDIRELYLKDAIRPFPYDDLRQLQCKLEREFLRLGQDESINADYDAYCSYIAGLASGGVERYLSDKVERHNMKQLVSKSFFEWFPQYRFIEGYDLTGFDGFDRDLKLHDRLRSMLLEIITQYEAERCSDKNVNI